MRVPSARLLVWKRIFRKPHLPGGRIWKSFSCLPPRRPEPLDSELLLESLELEEDELDELVEVVLDEESSWS